MTNWKDMQTMWQTQPVAPDLTPPAQAPRMPRRLQEQLRLFDLENGAKSFLAQGIIYGLLGILWAIYAWREQSLWLALAPTGTLLISGYATWLARRMRGLKLPPPDLDLRAYLTARKEQLGLYLRSQRIFRGLAGLAIIGFGYPMLQETEVEMSRSAWVGVGAFAALALMLVFALLWWYRTQHPYRPQQLYRELTQLSAEFEEPAENDGPASS